MSRLGPVRTASGGLLRHKVQAVVIGMVLLVSTASATLGLALLAATDAPFQHAFAAQHGADLTVTVNAARASAPRLAATRGLSGVTAAAGPFAEATVQTQYKGQPFGQFTLAGRTAPGGPLDDLVLNSGHWPDGPGQVVLDGNPARSSGNGPVTGSELSVTGVPGKPSLIVVGFANSITNTADGWVTPGEIAALRTAGSPPAAQMLYSFTAAGSYTQVRADAAAITRALPAGAVADAAPWLTAQLDSEGNGAIMEPFVIAFALIGLVMAVLIVGNVVSGAVVAGYRRIGVLKSIGLTPGQVVAVYLSRIGLAGAGKLPHRRDGGKRARGPRACELGVGAYGVGHQTVPWWASVIALGRDARTDRSRRARPALQAGGVTRRPGDRGWARPRCGRGYDAHRHAARLRLPPPASLGLAAPFAKPARTTVTLAAIAFGATAVIFAFGLSSSLNRADQTQNQLSTVPVQIQEFGPGGGGPGQVPSAAQDAAVTAALRAQPGTLHEVTLYGDQVKVPGIGQNVNAQVFGGAAAWTGWGLIAGRWYDAPGEVDVNTAFLEQSGLAVGDTASVNTGTAQVSVRIAGEVFQPSREPRIYASAGTLPGIATAANLWQWDVGLRQGTSAHAYIQTVNGVLTAKRSPWAATPARGGDFYSIATALVGLLSLMVAVAAGLGVLNTILMTSRDRVHDLGIFKALGMRPGQMLTMVTCWIIGPAVLAAVIAAPAAVALNSATLAAMGRTSHTGVASQLHPGVPAVPARAAFARRAGHRGGGRIAPGKLGGPRPARYSAARRVGQRDRRGGVAWTP